MSGSALTISEIESHVQKGLEALRNLPFNEQISLTMKYLLPEGYRPIIQLEEEGRKKRSTASADSWNPATGEILIYFEPSSPGESALPHATHNQNPSKPDKEAPPASLKSTQPIAVHSPVVSAESGVPVLELPTETEINQCCQALADAEKAGKHFIALKWFRDDFLPTIQFGWATSPQRRHAILTAAIDSGKVLTKKRPNPKAPDFPTTTITLNREASLPGVLPRFRPIPVRGEPASATLLRDRGTY